METFRHDLRFALRLIWKDRGFAATVILTLALCIGGNAAIFTVVRSVLLRAAARRARAGAAGHHLRRLPEGGRGARRRLGAVLLRPEAAGAGVRVARPLPDADRPGRRRRAARASGGHERDAVVLPAAAGAGRGRPGVHRGRGAGGQGPRGRAERRALAADVQGRSGRRRQGPAAERRALHDRRRDAARLPVRGAGRALLDAGCRSRPRTARRSSGTATAGASSRGSPRARRSTRRASRSRRSTSARPTRCPRSSRFSRTPASPPTPCRSRRTWCGTCGPCCTCCGAARSSCCSSAP